MKTAIINALEGRQQIFWKNDYKKTNWRVEDFHLHPEAIVKADATLRRYAPFLTTLFPNESFRETLIESDLVKFPYRGDHAYLKCDHALPISGSIKARGGIYEVLVYFDGLLKKHALTLDSPLDAIKTMTGQYKIAVGSTGNLGLSIGIMGKALGFEVIVHMSQDAKAWKKEKLRSLGCQVVAHTGDYSHAVQGARLASQGDPMSHFVDDETSETLFMGYAVAALRLKEQLKEMGIQPPFNVVLPCGVGGAPGGIAWGLKCLFEDQVKLYIQEPIEAPCMVYGIANQTFEKADVRKLGLGKPTQADGLAVHQPSPLVAPLMGAIIDGFFTVSDDILLGHVARCYHQTAMFLEPSSVGIFEFVEWDQPDQSYPTIYWATGGNMVPDEVKKDLLEGVAIV